MLRSTTETTGRLSSIAAEERAEQPQRGLCAIGSMQARPADFSRFRVRLHRDGEPQDSCAHLGLILGNRPYSPVLTLATGPRARISAIRRWSCTSNRADGHQGRDGNNLVHSERFQVYKVPNWTVKTEIVGIAPATGWPCETGCCPVQEYGGMP